MMKNGLELRPFRDRFIRNSGRPKFVETCIPRDGVGAEIGVYKGQFTRILLDVAKPVRLHLIDPWYLLGVQWKWARGNRSTIDALRSILRAYGKELASGQVVLNIADDLKFLPTFDDGYFDWVYLDSTHAYQQTVKELEILKRKVKANGVIAGDDWQEDPSHRHYGVCRAVREFAAREHYEIVHSSTADKQWAIRKI